MPVNCKICGNKLSESPDSIVFCKFKEGVVHLGCCINSCSWNNEPCKNASAIYDKLK